MADTLFIFQQYPFLLFSLVFLIGLIVGSFLNVVIHRLPVIMQREWEEQCRELANGDEHVEPGTIPPFNLVVPRSQCPKCGHKITALENIPVLSFIFLKGRCAECHNPISPRYPIVELLSAVATLIVVWVFGLHIESVYAALLTWALIALSFIDIDHYLLPDNITLTFLWAGLTLHLFGDDIFGITLESAVIGAVAGYLSLWLVYQIFRLITGKEGMGFGDFKLLSMFGAWFGWQMIPLIIILSSAAGALIGGTVLFLNKLNREHPIPFGPYLCIAGWIAMLWGDRINMYYLHFARF